jgi:hypothetical protein
MRRVEASIAINIKKTTILLFFLLDNMATSLCFQCFIPILQGKAQMDNGTTTQIWEGFMNFLPNKIIVELILKIEKFLKFENCLVSALVGADQGAYAFLWEQRGKND